MAENAVSQEKKVAIRRLKGSRNPVIMHDKNWRYPNTGDDQKSCRMLDFMLKTEYRSGIMVFIPDVRNKCRMVDRNKD